MDAEHMLIVQLTSAVALAASFIALYLMYKAQRRYTHGPVKRLMGQFTVQIALFCVALIFMLIYHVWDVDLAKDLWHYVILAAMLLGAYVYCKFVWLNKQFSSK